MNLATNQGYQPLHLKAKQVPYDFGFVPLNFYENQMVPMCNSQFFKKFFGKHGYYSLAIFEDEFIPKSELSNWKVLQL